MTQAAAKPQKTFEQRLWDAADAMHGNQEPSEAVELVLEQAELLASHSEEQS